MVVVACARCGAKNRVDERAVEGGRQPVCGKCGAKLAAGGTAAGTGPGPRDGKTLEVTDATFARDVLGVRGVPVLLDCWAPWCGPCRMIAPVLDQLASEYAGKVKVTKLDVDSNIKTATRFNVRSIPTILFFKGGKLVDQVVGAVPKAQLDAKFKQHAA